VGAPPRAHREWLWSELPAAERHRSAYFPLSDTDPWRHPSRAAPAALRLELDLYGNLLEQGDTVADWPQAARAGLIDPVTGQSQVRLTTRLTDGPPYGEPYGMALTLTTWTLKQRLLPGNQDGWARLLDELRSGRLREVHADLEVLNGEGMPSQLRSGVRLEVVLRDQFVDDTGPLPDHHPARVMITLGEPVARGGAIPDLTVAALELAKQAAVRLGAVTGFVAAGRDGFLHDLSPYEDRIGDDPLRRLRLDRVTRGAHWGTLFTAHHLKQIGGIQALHDLRLFHAIELLAGPPSELVWAQLTPDPYHVPQVLLDTHGARVFASDASA
jgi:hypothetical protein